jgi:amino acid transporter
MMMLSYFLTCPFEALAAGRISGYLFPSLNTIELYRLGGQPVYLPHVGLGLTIIVLLTWLNYRGIAASARLAKATTFTFLTLVLIFAAAGAKHGNQANLHPLFSHAPLLSVLLVWQVVPWLMSGFESVGKSVEEASPDFPKSNFVIAILLTIASGLVFFWIVISAVAYVAPWQTLKSHEQFPTAVAFEEALHAHWIVTLIMASAFVALLQAFNANMVASSRLLFAMGRSQLLDRRVGRIHPVTRTPSTAVIAVGVGSALTMLLGEAGLVPILEVGAVAASVGWMSACVSYYCMKPSLGGRAAALFGLLVTAAMILVKALPFVPGHFTRYEWLALSIWLGVGFLLRASGHKSNGMDQPGVSTVIVETQASGS